VNKWLWWVVTLAVAAGALVYAFWDVDFARLGAVLARGDYRLLLPFLACLFLFYVFTGLRWSAILRPIGRYSLAQVSPAMMIGFAGNNLLPARLGEIIRAIVFARQYGRSRAGVLTTLGLERLLDVFSILFFYFLAVLLIDPFPASIRLGSQVAAWGVAGVCAGLFGFVAFPRAVMGLWARVGAWLPEPLAARGARLLENVAQGLAALKSLPLLLAMLAWSVVKWLAAGGMVWLSLMAYGEPIGLGVSMIVVAVAALAVTLPTTPGFVGAMQAAFVFALVPFGVARETALAASILFVVAQWVPVTAVGVAWSLRLGARWSELRAAAEAAE